MSCPTYKTSPTHPEPPKGTSEWLDWFLGWHYQSHHVKLWDHLWFCIHTGNSTVVANAKQILENDKL